MSLRTILKLALIVAYIWAALEIVNRPVSGIPLIIQTWLGINPTIYAAAFVVGAVFLFWSSHQNTPANLICYLPFIFYCLALIEHGMNSTSFPATSAIAAIALVAVGVDYIREYTEWAKEPQS